MLAYPGRISSANVDIHTATEIEIAACRHSTAWSNWSAEPGLTHLLANRRHGRRDAREHQQSITTRRTTRFASRQDRQPGSVSTRVSTRREPSAKADVVEGHEDANLSDCWHHHSAASHHYTSRYEKQPLSMATSTNLEHSGRNETLI